MPGALSIQRLQGIRVSYVWFADHSVCYLELGLLCSGRVRPNGTTGNPRGEVTIFLGYDWLVTGPGFEKSRKELHPQQAELQALTGEITGAKIELATLSEENGEIKIALSTGLTLLSVGVDSDGPDWSVSFNE